jgi:hypothetical protein
MEWKKHTGRSMIGASHHQYDPISAGDQDASAPSDLNWFSQIIRHRVWLIGYG